ncbi:MAG: BrnT family toxin [Gammaproteobacteria bacterium]|nr:BrnT family toxin [Gammaproteobacteria bacterium]
MEIEFDPEKNDRNVRERGISFEQAQDFEWDGALVWRDTRRDYSEERFIALGLIGKRLHSLVFTVRGDAVRIISLRKANRREELRYEQKARS